MTEQEFLRTLELFDQHHIIEHYRSLSFHRRQAFLVDNGELDLHLAFKLYKKFCEAGTIGPVTISPPDVITIPKDAAHDADAKAAHTEGVSLLRRQKVAALIVAGGQGSRLGFDGPKGTFPLSPVKGKTLFQLLAEQVRALSNRFSVTIPLLIMTSSDNHHDTIEFFKQNKFFGLEPQAVHFFSQGVLPAVSLEGKLILKDKVHLYTSPNGHGGSLKALSDSGLLSKMIESGYEELFYCQVDNPLVKIADPLFLGYHRQARSQVSTKVVRRRNVKEKVGVYLKLNGKDAIAEYSDLDERYMSALDEKGEILYWAGNTAIHIFSLSFIKELNRDGFALPYHCAKKSAYVISSDWEPASIDVWKFETFVFDAIPFARTTCSMEVKREDEFAPVKNKEGDDSPDTARRALSDLHRNWLFNAGIDVPKSSRLEISPLFALGPEDISARIDTLHISSESDIYIE
ncbi:MAG: UDP-N-acetylglucosamine/UDP-N-acetylgalactosamine diphosphorylase [Deltaproteobacteria bacterium]|nr:UDP-N-acetylglucosamine/UDP-N-acetylgalactosamine diphosphorylase [Deltaproteobacteria bacterium]